MCVHMIIFADTTKNVVVDFSGEPSVKMKQQFAPLKMVQPELFPEDCWRCKGIGKYSVMTRGRNGKFRPVVVICEFCYHRPKE